MSNIGIIVRATIGQTIHEQDSQAQFIAIMCVILLSLLIEEGDRRQLYWRQEENYMGIVNEGPLRVYAPPSNFEHRVDGGVLNPQRK
ncbi:MAG: hypothetical protein F6K18_17750 [Okeania sp. SIO2C2]|uniref:hypothetical protein n=1 Tax=Okeania sp. SIO2C2 TaxID=2607787 RepID=UPI0013B82D2E|nr:hypothetical protein [Okeania sp. SIO2C2]NEP88526.1 hypothetical protein [Okeania sp. SIO2C2]